MEMCSLRCDVLLRVYPLSQLHYQVAPPHIPLKNQGTKRRSHSQPPSTCQLWDPGESFYTPHTLSMITLLPHHVNDISTGLSKQIVNDSLWGRSAAPNRTFGEYPPRLDLSKPFFLVGTIISLILALNHPLPPPRNWFETAAAKIFLRGRRKPKTFAEL